MDCWAYCWSRRRFVRGASLAGLGLLAGCGRLPGPAQPPAQSPRLGVLAVGSPADSAPNLDALRQGLQELGYVEGQNLAMEYRYAAGRREHLPDLAADLVRLPVDLIVTPGAGAEAAKAASEAVPVVMATHADPVGSRLIASFAHPGGNVTGLTTIALELAGKRLELLKEAVPGASRVAVIWNAGVASMAGEYGETVIAAEALGVELQSVTVRQPADLDRAYEAVTAAGIDALVVLADVFTLANRAKIVALAAQSGLPAISGDREYASAGGLLAYGPNLLAQWHRAATYIDKILKGAKPADLPVERPREFDFVINLKTTQALGLTIPEHVLLQATEVIQ